MDSVTHAGSGAADSGTAASFMSRPRTPISTALHVDNMRHLSVERLSEDLVGAEPEVFDHRLMSCCVYLAKERKSIYIALF